MQIYKHFRELYKFRELLLTLTLREIKVRYKQTVLGSLWAIIQPLSLAFLFTIVFGVFLKVDSGNIPYPIFSYSALLPWTFFATSLSFGSLSVINNSNLVGKVYFPKETLPLASVGAAFLDFLVASVIFALMMVVYKVPVGVNILYLFPITLILVVFTSAVTLFCACLVVLWRDVKFVIPLALQLWLFLVPVIYPFSHIPEKYRFFYSLNPMAPIVQGFRSASLGTESLDYKGLAIAAVLSISFFIFSYSLFKKKERVFADII